MNENDFFILSEIEQALH